MAIRRRVTEQDGAAALAQVRAAFIPYTGGSSGEPAGFGHRREDAQQAFGALPRGVRATAVRYSLEELATLAPGNSVEVRVPPFGVTQCVVGPRHTRGTPPSVVEASAFMWCALVLGFVTWPDALDAAALSVSGERSDVSRFFPLF